MTNKWVAVRYGHKSSVFEAHIIPLCDKAIHTIPVCWCRPVRKKPELIYAHNALDGRE